MFRHEKPLLSPWTVRAREGLVRLPLSGKLLFGLVCGTLLLGVTLWLAHRSVLQVQETSQWTYRTKEVRVDLAAVGESLVAVESGQRGYLLTGDDRYFAADGMGFAQLQERLSSLSELTADDPAQIAALRELQRLIAVRMRQLERAVQLRREDGFEAALAFVMTDEGRRTGAQIRALLQRMDQAEKTLLEQRRAEEGISLRRNLLWSVVLSATTFLLLIAAYLLVRRENAARARAVRMLDEANATLETRIAASIEELSASNAALKGEIEQRAAAEAELQRSHELLETRVRERTAALSAATASKSRFLSAASHDLRQPLHSLTLLNATLRSQPLGTLAQEIVAAQQQSLDAMSKLVNALLNISMLEAGVVQAQVRDFALEELIGPLHSEFAPLAQSRGLALTMDASGGVIHSDPTLLRQIVQNLLGNALRYTQRGAVCLRARVEGAQARLEVSDTGPGIAADQLERIFEEFHQLRPALGQSREGFGLGLSIVRHLAKLLDIELQVSSEVGVGTKFTLLMSAGEQPAAAAPSVAAAPVEPAYCGHILLLDDEAPVRNATALFLRVDGHQVFAAGSVEEAMAQLEQMGRVPDVIVSDYQLGGSVTGVDFIEHARSASRSTIPAVVLSGDMLRVQARCAQLADCRLFHKPVDAEELSLHLRGILERGALAASA